MSRILKAPYIKIEKDIVIDNTFSIATEKVEEKNTKEVKQINNDELMEEVYKKVEEIEQNLIEEANLKASKIIEEANIEAENIKNKIIEEANIEADNIYKDSFDKGYEEGKIKAEGDFQSLKLEGENIVLQAKQEREETINHLEEEIVNFVIDTTKNILTNSFEFNKDIISLLIKKSLLSVKDIKNLKISVSSEQYDYVNDNKENILNVDINKNNIEIIQDNSLNNRECIIETEIGMIKSSVDEQLLSIKEALYYILN